MGCGPLRDGGAAGENNYKHIPGMYIYIYVCVERTYIRRISYIYIYVCNSRKPSHTTYIPHTYLTMKEPVTRYSPVGAVLLTYRRTGVSIRSKPIVHCCWVRQGGGGGKGGREKKKAGRDRCAAPPVGQWNQPGITNTYDIIIYTQITSPKTKTPKQPKHAPPPENHGVFVQVSGKPRVLVKGVCSKKGNPQKKKTKKTKEKKQKKSKK